MLKKYLNKQALIELIKEGLRIALFAAISAVLSWATTQIADLPPDSVYAVVGTLILRLVDKYVHENKEVKAKGLAPF